MSKKINLYTYEEGEYADLMNKMYMKLRKAGPCPLDKMGNIVLTGNEKSSDKTVDCNFLISHNCCGINTSKIARLNIFLKCASYNLKSWYKKANLNHYYFLPVRMATR